MRHLSKRGEALGLHNVPAAVVTLVVLAILIGLGASILLTTATNQCSGTVVGSTNYYFWNTTSSACNLLNGSGVRLVELSGSIAYNATSQGVTGMNTFGQWLPTIAIVLAAAVVIGLVLAYLAFRKNE